MGLRINTNVESLTAQHKLGQSKESLEHTQNKLASGSKIINAMDDAAGLAISERLRSSMRAAGQNIKNAQNGFYLLQTADGALNEVSNIVIRMKELSVNAASDTNGDKERGYLNDEYQALKSELDRVAQTISYNGRPLLNGEGGNVEIQVGPNNNDNLDRITVASNFDVRLESLGLADLDISNSEGARQALEPVEDALQRIASVRGSIGAAEARLHSTTASLQEYQENQTGAYSLIKDADLAEETANYTKYNILNQAGVAILAQANSTPQLALKLLNG